jgi:hypothetical protein
MNLFEAAPLLNLRRLDAYALAAMCAYKLKKFLHAGWCRMGRAAVRTADTHAGPGRAEEALCGQLPHFGIQVAGVGTVRVKVRDGLLQQGAIPAAMANVSSATKPLTSSPRRTSIPQSHSQLMRTSSAF